MNIFGETKTNEEKEIYEEILGKEVLSQKEKEREITETFYGFSLVATIQL